MINLILDGLLDTLKLLPYLFITFLILEFIEHKSNNKSKKILSNNQKIGPLFGGLLGGLPQCGFSFMAASLYSGKVITIGTLIAVFLSTSDEMLPIMISEKTNAFVLLKIVGFKILVGILIGFIIDLLFREKNKNDFKNEHINKICEHEHCDCQHEGIILSSFKHTIKTGIFILLANIIINIVIFKIGENNLSKLLLHKNILTYFVASIIGLIPNCASSVIITELYLSKLITIGTLFSGLLTGSGLGILLLFRTNKDIKENLTILSIIYFVGVLVGLLVDIIL